MTFIFQHASLGSAFRFSPFFLMLIIHYRAVMFQALFPTLKPFLRRIHRLVGFLLQFPGRGTEKRPGGVKQLPVQKTK
jgi:hypothetical protein